MARTAAARRYARALFSIARDENRVEEVRGELDDMAGVFATSPELHDAIFRPLHPLAERKGVLEAVADRIGTSPHVRHFYAYLVDQRRIIDFPAILSEYGRLADQAAGRIEARVRTAGPLSDAQRERLRETLCTRVGQDVQLSVELDESLVGGLVASVGDLVFDGSIRTHLENLRSNLAKG